MGNVTLSPGARQLPLRHISIRVPWHDNSWNGTVCKNPAGNAECLILERIRETRNDRQETANASKLWSELTDEQLPACRAERGAFLANFPFTHIVNHPYRFADSHAHFAPTPLTAPASSALCIPYRWMLCDSAVELANEHDVQLDMDLEKQATDAMGFTTIWMQQKRNQLALLDTFFSAVQ